MLPDFSSLKGFYPRHFVPGPWSPHVPFAYDLVAELKPELVVELGAYKGQSYFAFCQSALDHGLGTLSYAVDTWAGDKHSGFYDDSIYQSVKTHNDQYYSSFSYLLRRTFDEAASQFNEGTLDLLHIDGLHTYDAVKHDFELWAPKVKPGGIILFHDIVGRQEDFGVWRFWQEIAKPGSSFTFHQGHGLGVLKKEPSYSYSSPLLKLLFESGESEQQWLRNYYRIAAERISSRHEVAALNLLNQNYIQRSHQLGLQVESLDRELVASIVSQNSMRSEIQRIERMRQTLLWRLGAKLKRTFAGGSTQSHTA